MGTKRKLGRKEREPSSATGLPCNCEKQGKKKWKKGGGGPTLEKTERREASAFELSRRRRKQGGGGEAQRDRSPVPRRRRNIETASPTKNLRKRKEGKKHGLTINLCLFFLKKKA